jgi:hypothetical protein
MNLQCCMCLHFIHNSIFLRHHFKLMYSNNLAYIYRTTVRLYPPMLSLNSLRSCSCLRHSSLKSPVSIDGSHEDGRGGFLPRVRRAPPTIRLYNNITFSSRIAWLACLACPMCSASSLVSSVWALLPLVCGFRVSACTAAGSGPDQELLDSSYRYIASAQTSTAPPATLVIACALRLVRSGGLHACRHCISPVPWYRQA